MEHVVFERQFRTSHSEGYYLKNQQGDKVGRVDLHFATDVVYATLVVETDVDEDAVLDLIEQIDEEIVVTADVPRDDFLVTVYRGKDLGFYSDDYFGDDEDDEEDDEDEDGDEVEGDVDEEDDEEDDEPVDEKPPKDRKGKKSSKHTDIPF
jgi:hypothetical protein